MSDPNANPAPTPTEIAAGTTAGGNAGQAVTLEQLAAIVAALAGSVQTLTSQAGATQAFQTQIADALKSLESRVKQTSINDDNNMETSVVGTDDPFIAARNERIMHKSLDAQMLRLVSASVDHLIDMNKRGNDHFGALPPLAPRSPSGPGTTAG